MLEHHKLTDRLRGNYHIPVNDGAGPLNGSMTFSREFPVTPIQREAAERIERLEGCLMMAVVLFEDDAENKSEMSWLVQAKDLLGLPPNTSDH